MAGTVHSFKMRRRRRRVWPVALAAVLALIVVAVSIALALSDNSSGSSGGEQFSTVTATPTKTLPKSFIDRNTASPYVVLENVTTGEVLYSKNSDAKCYPASLTKLMTAIVACEAVPAETPITVGNEVRMISAGSSRAYLTPGSTLTLEQLIQALLLPSGNDAAYSIAVQVGKLISGNTSMDDNAALTLFCDKMNKKAQSLGCTGTNFANPDGYHADNHYTTAADMLKIANCALSQPVIARTVALPEVNVQMLSGQSVTWKNSNKLVREDNAFSYAGATGLKTGSTDEAGYCLIASAVKNGQTSIAVVMGAQQEASRWEDASGLLDISFQ